MGDSLLIWSWVFLGVYIGLMVLFGFLGMRRVASSDDFATARGGYGMLFLAFALTATTASGATFLGIPGLAYQFGLSAIVIYAVIYPLAVYAGVLVCFKGIAKTSKLFGSRSIPEALGDRYQSDTLRLLVAVFSLILLFYLAGQLVAGLVMFEQMLGLSADWALVLTSVVLMIYVTLGGAHADILTDGVQGFLMVLLAILVTVLFAIGYDNGGFTSMWENLIAMDPALGAVPNDKSILFDSWWDILMIFIAHLPLGLLPHIGNKLWALEDGVNPRRFVGVCIVFGLLLALMALGGILGRSVLGDSLLAEDGGPNSVMPALFIEIFPTWVAALLGVGILSAVMSTADGLVISSAQIFANDIYRRTLADKLHPNDNEATRDARVLKISRWGSILILLGSCALAWQLLNFNIALLVWIGLGGMMAASAGPLILGQLWRRATSSGAIAGFLAGAICFVILRSGWTPVFGSGLVGDVTAWLESQQSNSFACAAIGEVISVAVTIAVSLATRPPEESHLQVIFDE